ncbi:MAG: hypothetical protein AB8E15_04100 [Bdellovibrionales bacterium]
MKKLILASVFLFISPIFAAELSFESISGKYEITHPAVPSITTVEIQTDGQVLLVEKSEMGEYVCIGEAVIEGKNLTSNVECQDSATFKQVIDFSGVENYDKFTAPVYSSLFDMSLPMNFVKIQ